LKRDLIFQTCQKNSVDSFLWLWDHKNCCSLHYHFWSLFLWSKVHSFAYQQPHRNKSYNCFKILNFPCLAECDCVMSFTQPNDWIRVGEIFGSDGVRVVLWKPVCQHRI
jgi:hypothetical protein